MGPDFYAALGLARSATDADVKKAYRRLALKLHPNKCSDVGAAETLLLVSEAYEVLSNAQRRAVYDQFGPEGLNDGAPLEDGKWTEPYAFHGDSRKTFREFFGGENPFSELFVGEAGAPWRGRHGTAGRREDPAVVRDLPLSLEDLHRGCTKKMKISRRVMNEDGHTSSIRDKILSITVRPGWRSGTRITFPREGDQGPNNIPADIIFVVKEKPHSRFQRHGDNLVQTVRISLSKALTGCTVEVDTLDGRKINVPINDIVHPAYTKTIPGEGMPLSLDPEQRGLLLIHFDVVFPVRLSAADKLLIQQALPTHC
ncbi:dnaJ homolog subfamily B member 13 [Petromyzon marinus]|uniref:DnaJ homolog subfamily B member 13 n=1 Tax=Petromyzon marinus TaxID=7757 RepID=A0AAJ7XH82_PETMA|nr:dnaJ homolog subfamily B member 13 [Petromyzon marinus]